jgi:uncharacterized membrane protein YdbT with pleckstrin-like domain
MARRRNFPGKDIAWLEERLGYVLDEIAAGVTITSWGEGDSSAAKQTTLTPLQRKAMLLNDLNILDPATYSIDETAGITRTGVNFSGLNV